jgi:cellulase/cellobiase CelA1
VCRAAVGDCDLADECDGLGSACPVDAYASPGARCGTAGQCLERQCVSGQGVCERFGATYSVATTGTASERYCASVLCSASGAGGAYYTAVAPDGLACGAGMSCADNVCVASSTLKTFRWKVGGWSACVNARRSRAVVCVDEANAAAAAGACDAAVQPAAQEDCVAEIPPPSPGVTATATLTSSWAAGFCMDVKVENRGASTVTWAVTQTITAPGKLTQLWNAKTRGSTGVVTFTGGKSNKSLAAGKSTTFGYCASR